MTLLIYYTALWYWSAPLWLWFAGAVVWTLHVSWHYEQHRRTHRLITPFDPTRKRP